MAVYQYGNSVIIECTFYNEAGNPIDPDEDSIRFTLYTKEYTKLQEEQIRSSSKVSTGKYKKVLVVEPRSSLKNLQKYIYEFHATINGNPALKREFIEFNMV